MHELPKNNTVLSGEFTFGVRRRRSLSVETENGYSAPGSRSDAFTPRRFGWGIAHSTSLRFVEWSWSEDPGGLALELRQRFVVTRLATTLSDRVEPCLVREESTRGTTSL